MATLFLGAVLSDGCGGATRLGDGEDAGGAQTQSGVSASSFGRSRSCFSALNRVRQEAGSMRREQMKGESGADLRKDPLL